MLLSLYKASKNKKHIFNIADKSSESDFKQIEYEKNLLIKKIDENSNPVVESELYFYIANIMSGLAVESSFNNISQLVASKNFDLSSFNIPPLFINKIKDILSTGESNPIVYNCLKLLINLWGCNKFNCNLMDSQLVEIVINYIIYLHNDKVIFTLALNALTNISAFSPTFICEFISNGLLEILNQNMIVNNDKKIISQILDFLKSQLTQKMGYKYLFPNVIQFVPNLIKNLNTPVYYLKSQAIEILYYIISYSKEGYDLAIQNNLVEQISYLILFGDQSKLLYAYKVSVILIQNDNKDAIEFFTSKRFLNNQSLMINLLNCTPKYAYTIIEVLQALMPNYWHLLYSYGIINDLINFEEAAFNFKKYFVVCLNSFFDYASQEEKNSVAKDGNGFEFFCSIISSINDNQYLIYLLHTILDFLQSDDYYVNVALNNDMINILDEIEPIDNNIESSIMAIKNFLIIKSESMG